MSSTWLERARANHEDIEAYEKGIVQQLEDKPKKVSPPCLDGESAWSERPCNVDSGSFLFIIRVTHSL